MKNFNRHTRRIFIGFIGGLVTLAGLIMVPYPGPGWLVVFGGLAILSTEYAFAAKVLEFARGKYDQWVAWIKRQKLWVRLVILSLTGLVVLVTLWLFNAFGILNSILSLNIDWLVSPFLR